MVQIVELDPRDEVGLRAFHDTEQAAIRHDRPEAVIRTWPAFQAIAQTPSPYYRHTFLAAVHDGRTVGVADLGESVGDNDSRRYCCRSGNAAFVGPIHNAARARLFPGSG